MAHHEYLGEHLKPLSGISNYTIERGDPDPRGYSVVDPGGQQIGRVQDLIVDTQVMKARYLVVVPDRSASPAAREDGTFLIPVQDVDVTTGSRQVLVRNYTSNAAYQAWSSPEYVGSDDDADVQQDRTRLTRVEEELDIRKREVSRGEVRVGKHVETEHVSQPVTRRREEVVIERRPVEAGARADATISDDEIRIPLMEEEIVTEKRPVVKEELVVGKRVVEQRDTVEADVRREEFDVDDPTDARSRIKGSRTDR